MSSVAPIGSFSSFHWNSGSLSIGSSGSGDNVLSTAGAIAASGQQVGSFTTPSGNAGGGAQPPVKDGIDWNSGGLTIGGGAGQSLLSLAASIASPGQRVGAFNFALAADGVVSG